MTVFLSLLNRMIPLYLLVGAGFTAGRVLKVSKEAVATLLIYIIVPVVVFTSVNQAELTPRHLFLPFLFFLLCCAICLLFLAVSSRIWEGPTKNLAAFTAGDANTGYFGLPVAVLLFGQQSVGLAVLLSFGFIFYENTVGVYVIARGRQSAMTSFKRVAKLPTVYAFLSGVILNLLGLKLSSQYSELIGSFRGTYSVLGMMMIGLGVADLQSFKFDLKFVSVTFAAKFLVWPLIVLGLVQLDNAYLHAFDRSVHQMMILMASVPLAANTVALSALLKTEPEKAAVAVLLSTAVAVIFIPVMIVLFLTQ